MVRKMKRNNIITVTVIIVAVFVLYALIVLLKPTKQDVFVDENNKYKDSIVNIQNTINVHENNVVSIKNNMEYEVEKVKSINNDSSVIVFLELTNSRTSK